MMKTIGYFICLSLFFISCEKSTEPSTTVTAAIEASQLVIHNNTTEEVFYAYFEKSILAVIDWAPICRKDNLIKHGESKTIVITDSTFLPSNEAVVYWWHRGKKIENSDFYGPDELRTILVPVK